jgi:hypothetical protein
MVDRVPTPAGRFELLAGYRRSWLFDPGVLMELRAVGVDGMPLGAVSLALPHRPREIVSAAALHMLWQQHFLADLTRPLDAMTVLRSRTVTGGAVRIRVGTRLQYDGEVVTVVELVITQAGNEVVLQNAAGRLTAHRAARAADLRPRFSRGLT